MLKIPPVRNDGNVLVGEVPKITNIFNHFFANQCSQIDTDRVLPAENFKINLLNNVVLDEATVVYDTS